jgi:hypothetical protein
MLLAEAIGEQRIGLTIDAHQNTGPSTSIVLGFPD